MPLPPPRPLRLLFVIYNLGSYGGAENQLVHLARGLVARGYDVTICCINETGRDTGPLEELGVQVRLLGAASPRRRAAAIPQLVRLARAADVVQCTMWDASLWGRIAAILARRPVIVADHATDRSVQVSTSGEPREGWIALHNRLLDRFTAATVTCSTSQTGLLVGEGVAPGKIVHIPNGVPVAEMRAEAGRGPTREELGLPPTGQVVMHVGVFRPEKNQIGTLEAIDRLRHRIGDLQLVFVGGGRLYEDVRARALEMGADWVHFLGPRMDVPAILPLADLMVLPSHSDAMPMTVLEAMALGVPVVASDVGDVRRMLGDGGIVVPAGDSDAFERACEQVLSDAALRDELTEGGSASIREFDSELMVERYSDLFQRTA